MAIVDIALGCYFPEQFGVGIVASPRSVPVCFHRLFDAIDSGCFKRRFLYCCDIGVGSFRQCRIADLERQLAATKMPTSLNDSQYLERTSKQLLSGPEVEGGSSDLDYCNIRGSTLTIDLVLTRPFR